MLIKIPNNLNQVVYKLGFLFGSNENLYILNTWVDLNINLQIITSIKIIPIRSGQIHISHIGGSEFVMGGKFPPYTFPKPGV